jgi:thiamine biosynthesis lipoprotein
MRFDSAMSRENRDRLRAARVAPGGRATGPARVVLCLLLLAHAGVGTEPLSLVHQQRYAMGTMFDIGVYHASRTEAERAIARAMDEIVRLDGVLSHFKADSDLSRLVRGGRLGFVTVEPSLYEVIQESITFSRRSGGRFDVTIAPLVRLWKAAYAEGRRPSASDIDAARRCVGYEKIETRAPDRIRFHADCVELDLGGIGKGYAVDRAIAVLKAAGIGPALVNAGNSSIAALGAPPGRDGWPVELGGPAVQSRTLMLRDTSMSTSQQALIPLRLDRGHFGEILDPRTGVPIRTGTVITVVAPSATASDALSTTLLMFSIEEGATLLGHFPDVSAIWVSPSGEVKASYRRSRLERSETR